MVLIVKNTFLSDVPVAPGLRRARTCPQKRELSEEEYSPSDSHVLEGFSPEVQGLDNLAPVYANLDDAMPDATPVYPDESLEARHIQRNFVHFGPHFEDDAIRRVSDDAMPDATPVNPGESLDALHIQRSVKNTFINFAEFVPDASCLRRSQTDPLRQWQDQDEHEDASDRQLDNLRGRECDALSRLRTADSYESDGDAEPNWDDKAEVDLDCTTSVWDVADLCRAVACDPNQGGLLLPGLLPGEVGDEISSSTRMPLMMMVPAHLEPQAQRQMFPRLLLGAPLEEQQPPPSVAPEPGLFEGGHAPDRSCMSGPGLQRVWSAKSGACKFKWFVSSKLLQTTNCQHYSPAFELPYGPSGQNIQFKMIIRPLVVHDKRGGSSFKKSKGRGIIQLRCLDHDEGVENLSLSFSISVGPEECHGGEPPRGPVVHDFSDPVICGLPEQSAVWDFSKYVDWESQTFVINLATSPAVPVGES
jgi:hypothetical protein